VKFLQLLQLVFAVTFPKSALGFVIEKHFVICVG